MPLVVRAAALSKGKEAAQGKALESGGFHVEFVRNLVEKDGNYTSFW